MTEKSSKTLRCAIYTRKSTEHGLELEFNLLDTQREACDAYIKSQASQGWRALPRRTQTALVTQDPFRTCSTITSSASMWQRLRHYNKDAITARFRRNPQSSKCPGRSSRSRDGHLRAGAPLPQESNPSCRMAREPQNASPAAPAVLVVREEI